MGVRPRVFLSYRREVSWAMAHLVRRDLVENGFDVFLDVEHLDSGEWEGRLAHEIETRTHFVVLLAPGSLDRIEEPGDWLRCEIAHAFAHARNVVPVLTDGFSLGHHELPADMDLVNLNSVSIPPEYVDAALQRLRQDFLQPRPVDSGEERRDFTSGQLLKEFGKRIDQTPRFGARPDRDGVALHWRILPWMDPDHVELQRSRHPSFFRPFEIYRGHSWYHIDPGTGGVPAWFRIRALFGGVPGPWNTVDVRTDRGIAPPPWRPSDQPPQLTLTWRNHDTTRLDWTPVRSASSYQVVRLDWSEPPPPDGCVCTVYCGPALYCIRPSTHMARYAVRALGERYQPVTDWSRSVGSL